jgi:type 1 glutamine amidotransferase
LEKGHKPELGKHNDQRKLKLHKKSSEIHHSANLVPDQSLEEMSHLVPALSGIYKNGPWSNISRKVKWGPLRIRELQYQPLENTLDDLQQWSL